MGTFRALGTGVALGPLRARRSRVTLETLGARVALRSLQPGVAGRPVGTVRPVVSPITLRAPRAVRTAAILHVAGAVVIHVLGREVTLAIPVDIPAVQAVTALRTRLSLGTLGARRARGTLGTR